MLVRENWALSAERIADYLLTLDGARRCGPDAYMLGRCRVELSAVPDGAVGPFRVARTVVTFSGPDGDVEAMRGAFKLRFLSAGG